MKIYHVFESSEHTDILETGNDTVMLVDTFSKKEDAEEQMNDLVEDRLAMGEYEEEPQQFAANAKWYRDLWEFKTREKKEVVCKWSYWIDERDLM